jgi:hypothetical protein
MGVKLRLVQYPCKFGWPSGVRDTVAFADCVAAVAVLAGACAARNDGASKALAITTGRTLDEILKQFFI